MIAVSLNVGGGVRLIKPAKLCMCTQTLQTQRGRTHGAGCVRQWFRTAEPLGERRYENWNTHTHTHTYLSKVLALHAGSRGFDSHRGHMSERFFRSNRPGYPHPVSSELENSGIRVASALSNRQNCACARKTLQTRRGRTHGAGCVRQWFRTAEPLGERRYEN